LPISEGKAEGASLELPKGDRVTEGQNISASSGRFGKGERTV
jgi:hypothetical protein